MITPGLSPVRHRLAPLADIPVGEGRAFAVAGQQIAVFRLRDGGLRAVQAVCPHLGGPLADGQIDDGSSSARCTPTSSSWRPGARSLAAAPTKVRGGRR